MGFWKNDSEMHKSIKKGNHYAHLTPIQQSAYDAVVEGLAAFQKKIMAKGISSKEEMERVISAVIWEQPQLFYFNCNVMSIVQTGAGYQFMA